MLLSAFSILSILLLVNLLVSMFGSSYDKVSGEVGVPANMIRKVLTDYLLP